MGLEAWAERMAGHRRALALVGLLVAFTGVSMVLSPTHATELASIGVVLLVIGFALLTFIAWPRANGRAVEQPSMGSRLITRLTFRGRLIPLFPAFGVALIILDLAYNFFLSATPALATEDIMVLLSAVALLGYAFVPTGYTRERELVLLFFFFLDLLLVVPLLVARIATRSVDASVDLYSWVALAPEVGAMLSGLGVANTLHPVAGFTAPGLTFTPVHMATPVTVVITTACSGLYSFGIFAAGYAAFLLTEYRNPTLRLWLLVGLGFGASYVANLLRMVIIVLVGYYTDSATTDLQNLLLAHSYAGWIIFLAWLALFWGLLFKFLPVEREVRVPAMPDSAQEPATRHSVCAICQESLSPAIPATRCDCGRFYHVTCLLAERECPGCHRSSTSVIGRVAGGS